MLCTDDNKVKGDCSLNLKQLELRTYTENEI